MIMNKTKSFTLDAQNRKYAKLKSDVKFALPAMDDLLPKSTETYKNFYDEQTEITSTFLYETQQHNRIQNFSKN